MEYYMGEYEVAVIGAGPVSYTHLDVYKRQVYNKPVGDRGRLCLFCLPPFIPE